MPIGHGSDFRFKCSKLATMWTKSKRANENLTAFLFMAGRVLKGSWLTVSTTNICSVLRAGVGTSTEENSHAMFMTYKVQSSPNLPLLRNSALTASNLLTKVID